MARDIGEWLEQLGLGEYVEAFTANKIDAGVLSSLTNDDLKDIGVQAVGDRRKLLNAVASLGETKVGPPDEPVETVPSEVQPSRDAERRQLTVMFCDLVGSTALAERLDPELMRDLIRSYQIRVTDEITRFDGHVAKFMGDGVLAYFGWPRAHEDDAERAVRSGLAVAEATGRIAAPTGEPLQVRVGIATGLVVVGNLIGEGAAQEETVVGATPNLAARLQGMAAGNTVVIADSTRALLGEQIVYEDLGPQELRGFSEQVHVWRVVRLAEAGSRFEAIRGPRLTPLVGRKEELDLLGRRWAQAKEGEGQVVLLTGEAGIGKSRIAHSLHEQITKEPHVRLLYQCSPYYTNSALYPFIRQLERAARLERDDTDRQRLDKLEALLAQSTQQAPEVAALFAALLSIDSGTRYPPLVMSPQKQKEDTLRVLLEQLEGLAERQAALLVFEDVHWLDPTSQELLDLIVERVEGLPVLVLITFRPEYTPPWSGETHVTLLALNRLNRDLGAAMVHELIGRKELPQKVLEQIVIKTDGIPLFVEELTKTILVSGLLEEKQDRYAVIGELPEHAIPTTLKDSLMARLDQLAPVKEVAQAGAVIGREFSYKLLAEISTLPNAELAAALEQLSRSELIFRRGVPPNARYRFKHALVQDTAYESLLKSRRQQLHARIAEVIEEKFPDRVEVEPELLAHHYTESGLAEQAIVYWQRAGERSIQRSANLEASGHLAKGLELVESLPETPERREHELSLWISLATVLSITKGWAAPEVEHAYARARDLCRRMEDTPQLFWVLRGLFYMHFMRAEFRKARELAEQLLQIAERRHDPGLLVIACPALGATLLQIGEVLPARARLEQGIALYEPKHHASLAFRYGTDPGVLGLFYTAWALWALGYPERSQARANEALALARELSHPFSLAIALNLAAMLHPLRSEIELSRAQAEVLIELSIEQHFALPEAMATIVRGWALARQGQGKEGIAQLRRGMSAYRSCGSELFRPYYLTLLADAYGRTGQSEEGLRVLSEALTLVDKSEALFYRSKILCLEGQLLLALSEDNEGKAADCFEQALATARRQQAKAWELRAATSLCRLWQQQGKRYEAHRLLAEVYDWFTEGLDTPDLKEAKALLEELDR